MVFGLNQKMNFKYNNIFEKKSDMFQFLYDYYGV